MAQLKDTVIQGSLRVTDTTITTDLMVTATKTARYAFIAPTSNGAPTWRALTKADISDFPTSMAPTSHNHAAADINSGTFGVARGGTGQSSFTVGDILYASASTTLSKLTGNTTTTAKFLRSKATTSGTAIAPSWETIVPADVGLSSQTAASGGTTLSLVTTGEKYTWNNKSNLTIGAASTQAMAGNTDVNNVTISANTTTNANYPLVFGTTNSSTTTAVTEKLQKSSTKFYVNPSTGNIQATTFNGYTLAAACAKAVVTSIDTSASLPTANAVKSFVEGKGYTTNTGTVTTVATGSGLTGGPITTSGTISIATGGVTNAMLAGSIDNSKLSNSTISIGGNSVALGGSISLADLGLDSAMHYRGTVTAIPPASGTYSSGDVVVLNNTLKEYVYDGTDWRELGSEGSYKVKQTAYSDSTGTSENTTATRFVYSVTQTADGVVSFKTRPLPTYNNYSLPIAAYNTLGGLKPPYSNTKAATITTTAASVSNDITIAARSTTTGRYYAIEVDKDGVPFVNVPWTNVNSSYLTGVTTTVSGSGNGVTGVTASGSIITVTKGNFLTSHQTYTSFTGKPTGNQTPGFGSTFTIQQISQSTAGQVSGTDRTVTIPNTIAKNDTVGLVKPWYNHTSASTGPTAGSNATAVAVNTITTTSGRYYAIEADSNGRLFVNVPWSAGSVSTMTGATANVAGTSGLVPAPAAGDQNNFLCGDGTWSSYSPTVLTLTLTASSWTSEKTQAIPANGVTTTNTVIVGPAPSSITDYTNANIVCTTQGVDVLVFSTTRTPTTDITINVVIFDTDDNLTVSQNALTGALTIS